MDTSREWTKPELTVLGAARPKRTFCATARRGQRQPHRLRQKEQAHELLRAELPVSHQLTVAARKGPARGLR